MKLPKVDQAMIAEHEAGRHDVYNDGYPTKGPQPETCRECARTAEPAGQVVAEPLKPQPLPKRTIDTVAKEKQHARQRRVIEKKATIPDPEPAPMPAIVYTTREAWLMAAVEKMAPLFAVVETEVPDVRVSVGWPAGRSAKKNTIGQCFQAPLVADGVPAIFISPVLTDPVEVLATLVHEVVHAIIPANAAPHRGPFVKLAKAVGLVGPWTATKPGDDLKATLTAMADELGDFGHAKVSKGIGAGRKVQGTRMLKVECPDCGCVIRMTRKWLDEVGAPTCACGEKMMELT